MNRIGKLYRHLRSHGPAATVVRVAEISAESFSRIRTRTRTRLQRASGRRYVRSSYGIRMRANWDDETFGYCLTGKYGTFYAEYLRALDRGFSFVDIGANQGLYTILAAFNPCCARAIAFEPVPATFELLVDNVRINGRADRVTPVRAAVSARCGQQEIHCPRGHSGGASLVQHGVRAESEVVEVVEVVDVSAVDRLLPTSGDVVVKIDVEGHESVVIDELLSSRHVDRISSLFYEIQKEWLDPAPIERRLRREGFSVFESVGEGRLYDVLATR